MYKLYGSLTTRAFRAGWLLEELGQDYEVVSVYPHSPEVKSVNAQGKVPVLEDDDLVLTDSTAILTYLADKHGAMTAPAGTAARAQQDAVMFRVLDELEGPIWAASKHSFVWPEAHRDAAVVPPMVREFSRALAKFADDMNGDFAAGDTFTFVDIIVVHLMSWALYMKIPLEHEGLKAYSKRMRGREAYQKVAAAMKAASAG